MQKNFLYIVIFVLISSCISQQETIKTPNILFIMSDDHDKSAISAYGEGLNKTPHIDHLASEGMIFNNAYVANSICAPSRATILTGKHSHFNGVIDNREPFDTSQITFPRLLQEAGYETAMIGKWHLKTTPQGFNYHNVLPGQGQYYNPDFIEMGERKRYEGYVSDLITDFAIGWLDSLRDKNKPFLLMYHHKAPHRSWEPALKYLAMYDSIDIKEPSTLRVDTSGKGTAFKEQEMTILHHMMLGNDLKISPDTVEKYNLPATGKWPKRVYNHLMKRLTDEQKEAWLKYYDGREKEIIKVIQENEDLLGWKYQQYMEDYLGCIASVDENVGRVLDYLEEENLDDNTLVVYTSDQGFYLGENGWFDKRFMYDVSMSTPLLMKWPGVIESGTINNDLVQNIDFAQTFLDVAGVSAPEDMQGKSLLPLIKGQETAWRDALYYHYYEFPAAHHVYPHYGIRKEDYKLICFYTLDEWELYDLKADPDELNNLYFNNEYSEQREVLMKELRELQKFYGDTVMGSE